MVAREIPPLGEDILDPDFADTARSFHVAHHAPQSPDALRALLAELADGTQPVLVELHAASLLPQLDWR